MWILVQHSNNEIFACTTKVYPVFFFEFKFLVENVVKNLFIVVSFERRVPAQENIQDDTKGPNIALTIVVTS